MSEIDEKERGTYWIGKPEEFLAELPKKIIFQMIGSFEGQRDTFNQIILLKSNNDSGTLWEIKYVHSNSVIMTELIYRRKTPFIPRFFQDSEYSHYVWLTEPRGEVNFSNFTGLRSFQNIGFDIKEKLNKV